MTSENLTQKLRMKVNRPIGIVGLDLEVKCDLRSWKLFSADGSAFCSLNDFERGEFRRAAQMPIIRRVRKRRSQ